MALQLERAAENWWESPWHHRSPTCALLPDTQAAEGTLIREGVGEAEGGLGSSSAGCECESGHL